MKFLIAILLLTAAQARAHAECESDLRYVRLSKIEGDVLNRMNPAISANVKARVYPDNKEPDMLLIEDFLHVIPHELRMAREYAKFSRRMLGEHFLFMGAYKGLDLPTFDGLQLNSRLEPIANISLKCVRNTQRDGSLEDLVEYLQVHLTKPNKRGDLISPSDWFRRSNNLPYPPKESGFAVKEFPKIVTDYGRLIARAAETASLFNLFSDGDYRFGRELKTVIDMRESKWQIEMFNDEKARQEIIKLVDESLYGKHTLVLMWDYKNVIEFGRHRAIQYRAQN